MCAGARCNRQTNMTQECTLERIFTYTRSIERMLYTFFKCKADAVVFDAIKHERGIVFSETLEAIERKEEAGFNSSSKAEPDTPKRDSDFALLADIVVRKETAEQLRPIVAISQANLTEYARNGVFPASQKGRLWFFSSDEIIKKIKSCYAVENKYVPGNRLAFLYAVKIAQKDNPHAAFLTITQMSNATRISVNILNDWRRKGLKSYKLPKARTKEANTSGSITSSGTVLLSFSDVIDFLQKGGEA